MDDSVVDRYPATDTALLPGETADSNSAEDAEHWAAVYEELTGFLVASDFPGDTLDRFRRRLQHWRCRRDELSAGRPGEVHLW